MKTIRCEVSAEELDRALRFTGVTTVGEGANMRITRMPESIGQQRSLTQPKQTLEQELADAEAELARLESKVFALEGDIAWLVDAMRRIGEKLL